MADKLQGPQALVTPAECLRNYLNTSWATENLENIAVSSSLHEQQWSHSQPDICWYNEQFDPWLWAMQVLTATGKLDCQPVNAAVVTGSSSLLQLYDKNSRLHFLIATGAAISMFLAGLSHRFQKSDVTLQAENNSIKHQQFVTVNPWIWAPTSPHLEFLGTDVT